MNLSVCEKIRAYGTTPLSNSELLQVLLGSKGSEKLNTLLNQYDLKNVDVNDDSTSNVLKIVSMEYEKLKHKGKLTDLETSRVLAAIELGIRISNYDHYKSDYMVNVDKPYKLARYLMPKMRYLDHEVVVCVALDTRNTIIGTKILSHGTSKNANVDVKAIFNYAILTNCSSIVLAHNHLSAGGKVIYSEPDLELTHIVYSAGIIMGIPLLDHIIIGDGCYYSFYEDGKLVPPVDNK